MSCLGELDIDIFKVSFDTKIQGTSEIAWNSAVGQGKKKKKKKC